MRRSVSADASVIALEVAEQSVPNITLADIYPSGARGDAIDPVGCKFQLGDSFLRERT